MLKSQRIEVELSEAREASLRCRADVPDSEHEVMRLKLADLTRDLRVAKLAEQDANARHGNTNDAASRELDALAGRAQVRNILDAVVRKDDHPEVDGAERELQQAVGLPPDGIPWRMLIDERAEHRVDADAGTPTTIGDTQRSIIERVFANSVLRSLGVEMPTAGTGDELFYVVSAGADGAFASGTTAVDSEAFTLAPTSLQPVRLSAAYNVKQSDVMRVKGYEPALRSDLRDTLMNRLEVQVLGLGNATLRGFLATAANGGLPARPAPSDVVDYEKGLTEVSQGVDGTYASMIKNCNWVQGDDTYRKMMTLINTGSGQTLVEHLTSMLGTLRGTSNVPAPASNVQEGVLYRAGRRGTDAVCPVWGGGPRVIRDEVTQANTGRIRLTILAFHSFKLLRAKAYQRTSLKLA